MAKKKARLVIEQRLQNFRQWMKDAGNHEGYIKVFDNIISGKKVYDPSKHKQKLSAMLEAAKGKP
jgi:hypothetical protein